MYPGHITPSSQMDPYSFQLPTHTDSHDVSQPTSRLVYHGFPSSTTIIRPFRSSATASGQGSKEPSSSGASGGGMMLPPLPPMMTMRGPPGYPSSTSQYHQTLPPVPSYHGPPPTHERQHLPLPRSPPRLHVAPRHSYHNSHPYASIPVQQNLSTSPSTPSFGKHSPPARKRSRHAWPADMTRQIINVLLDEFLNDPSFRTTIYRSREERDHRFEPSGRTILEEYNKVQNIRRRYFIPLSYLLQWDQLKRSNNARNRLRANIEKKLAKPLERSRLQMIFLGALRAPVTLSMPPSLSTSTSSATLLISDELSGAESEAEDSAMHASTPVSGDAGASKPVFELDIFVTELKRRDPQLWAQGSAAFNSWVSRKCSVDYILNH
ncbi:hypothetical protein H4S04_008198 [Coemansia sp. S16]|nr:hypothetical protein GGI14_003659 [Coemansia sp. S680]KAJ2033223.1 hypothetical protein H4S03_005799 [Coemansia sp. S3946]KAJ2039110.1 hypothetical protein H4S04_008198 [Coemansia sp. S16]KAJ2054916.1 hypothetical protein GGH13_008036 [Coemansia sp. S155-1]KAJ2095418.1 hypothetical protein GGI16_005218 [Coemansia sp. S142-1]KAJ2097960.1 hypothetical protein GGI09_003556 [Coemansia sp. S100]